jgi:alginate O-acetyltransferase complex protein AlgI
MYFLDYRFLAFVPLLVIVYWLAGARLRNWVLLAGNLAWLAFFTPATLVALTAITVGIVYPLAVAASRARGRAAGAEGSPDARRASLLAWIGVGALIAIATVLRLRAFFPELTLSVSPLSDELLHWIGFSYFLLKAIHVLFATARGILPAPTLLELVHYVLFVPTLTSGPIYRLDVFTEQLAKRKTLGWDDIQDGLLRILEGLAKKVVLVPFLVSAAASLSAGGVVKQPAAYVVTYAMLFLDFSAYSDIAIGIGRLLGFSVPENFKNPFAATTLTQFWRLWHATLGDWLRENIFIPMGGVRAKGWHLAGIVVFSMLVVGVWHGFHWMFIVWGLYHGTALLIENRLRVKPLHAHRTAKWRLWLRYAIIQAIVIGGMFIFTGWSPP